MANSFGKLFTITTFGESHGEALGGIIDGCPSGIKIDFDAIIAVLMAIFSFIVLFSCCFCTENCKFSGSLFSYCLFFNFKVCICYVCVIFSS